MGKTVRDVTQLGYFRNVHIVSSIRDNLGACEQLEEWGQKAPSRLRKPTPAFDDFDVSAWSEIQMPVPKEVTVWHKDFGPMQIETKNFRKFCEEKQQEGYTSFEVYCNEFSGTVNITSIFNLENVQPWAYSWTADNALGLNYRGSYSGISWRQRRKMERDAQLSEIAQKPSAWRLKTLFLDSDGDISAALLRHKDSLEKVELKRSELLQCGYGQKTKGQETEWKFWTNTNNIEGDISGQTANNITFVYCNKS